MEIENDNLDFFNDTSDFQAEPQADPAPAEQTPEPAQPAFDPNQFTEMQKRLEASEKWRQDLGRMMLGENQIQQTNDPTRDLEEFVKDPSAFLTSRIVPQATQQAQEAAEQAAILADRRTKYPELAQLEQTLNWGSIAQQVGPQLQQKLGRQPSYAELVDGSINHVQTTFPQLFKSSQTQQAADTTKRLTMNLDLTGNGSQNPPTFNPAAISDADWPKYWNEIQRRASS